MFIYGEVWRATLFASPSHLSLLTSLSPIQLTDSHLLCFSHSSGDSIQNLLPLFTINTASVPLLPFPPFSCRTLIIFCCLSSLLQFHSQLHQLVNMIKILTIKKGLNSTFPLKKSRELSFHPMTPLNTVEPPLMHSQPVWRICLHYFYFLTSVICQFTAIWLWLPLLQ